VWDGGDRRFFAGILAGFAGLVAACGQPERAARLCGAAAALVDAVGVTLSPAGQTSFERATASARAGLDDATFLAAMAAGRAMTPADVLAEVAAELLLSPERQAPEHGGQRGPGTSIALTARELDVLRLVADGLSDREVAEVLFVVPGTVRAHLANAFGKLGVGSRTAAVAAARRHGLL
jgi:DNA-binding NarL/FixJ family response regulator